MNYERYLFLTISIVLICDIGKAGEKDLNCVLADNNEQQLQNNDNLMEEETPPIDNYDNEEENNADDEYEEGTVYENKIDSPQQYEELDDSNRKELHKALNETDVKQDYDGENAEEIDRNENFYADSHGNGFDKNTAWKNRNEEYEPTRMRYIKCMKIRKKLNSETKKDSEALSNKDLPISKDTMREAKLSKAYKKLNFETRQDSEALSNKAFPISKEVKLSKANNDLNVKKTYLEDLEPETASIEHNAIHHRVKRDRSYEHAKNGDLNEKFKHDIQEREAFYPANTLKMDENDMSTDDNELQDKSENFVDNKWHDTNKEREKLSHPRKPHLSANIKPPYNTLIGSKAWLSKLDDSFAHKSFLAQRSPKTRKYGTPLRRRPKFPSKKTKFKPKHNKNFDKSSTFNEESFDKNYKSNINPYNHQHNLKALTDENRAADFLTKNYPKSLSKPKTNQNITKISLDFDDELYNCTGYSSLDDFMSSVAKKDSITTTEKPEEIVMDFTTLVISKETTNDVEPEQNTPRTESTQITSPKNLQRNEFETTGSSQESSTEENDNFATTITSEYESTETTDNSMEDTTVTIKTTPYETSSTPSPELDKDDMNFNIGIKANLRGNLKNKNFVGNGTIEIKPDFLDEHSGRQSFKTYKTRKKTDIDDGTFDHYDTLPYEKLSANLVDSIFRVVQKGPEFEILWPMLRRNFNERPQVPIRNKPIEKPIPQNEQLLEQALEALNYIAQQKAQSEECPTLPPDLQEYYGLMVKNQEEEEEVEQEKEWEKQEQAKRKAKIKTSQQKSATQNHEESSEMDLIKIEEKSRMLEKLLNQYERLSPDDQRQVSALNDNLLQEFSQLQAKIDTQKSQDSQKFSRNDNNNAYTPEYINLEKAIKRYQKDSQKAFGKDNANQDY